MKTATLRSIDYPQHEGVQVTILGQVDSPDPEDRYIGPLYRVQFLDGMQILVFANELFPA